MSQLVTRKKFDYVCVLEAGTRIEFVKIAKGQYAIKPATISLMSLRGMFHKPGRPTITIEQMNDAIAERGASAGKPSE